MNSRRSCKTLGIWLILAALARGGEPAAANDPQLLVDPTRVVRYAAAKCSQELVIDGKLDEACWQNATRTNRFVDLISGSPTIHDTRAAILWDATCLYIAFWVEEPLVVAKFKHRDAPIYRDNDIEVFIAGKDSYYEFEMNAYGTIYEALFIWQDAYERDGYDKIPGLGRSDPGVEAFDGVGFKNHFRGKRVACLAWDLPNLQAAVHVDGTLNQRRDRDRGWTAELAFPWKGMETLAKGDGRALPPRVGDVWRIDLFRFNQYKEASPAKDSGGWAVGKHGVWDSHVPEIFPYVSLSE